MFIYGSEASFEWGFADDDDPVITTAQRAEDGRRGGTTSVEARVMPNFYEMLPREIQKHTVGGNYDPPQSPGFPYQRRGGRPSRVASPSGERNSSKAFWKTGSLRWMRCWEAISPRQESARIFLP